MFKKVLIIGCGLIGSSILRDTKTYGIKNCLRLTIGNNSENKFFLKSINRIFKNV